MKEAMDREILPGNEKERLLRLYDYIAPDRYKQTGTFKHVAALGALIFEVPIAVVNFVDDQYVVTEASVDPEGPAEYPGEISLCSLAILQEGLTVFEDARLAPCLIDNPVVHGGFGLQFYAAAPIKTPDGFNIGAVAIADKQPRSFSEAEGELLKGLAALVMEELEERRKS